MNLDLDRGRGLDLGDVCGRGAATGCHVERRHWKTLQTRSNNDVSEQCKRQMGKMNNDKMSS
jgi:hypothetical protein